MSIYTPEELRYIKNSALVEERAIMANYHKDLIDSYGIDIIYIKRDPFFETSGINSDMIYGHQQNPTYTLSSNMVSFMEVDNAIMSLLDIGNVPVDDVTFYFGLNDFAVRFSNELSQYKEYPITYLQDHCRCNVTTLSGKFTSPVVSGNYYYNIPVSSVPTTGYLTQELTAVIPVENIPRLDIAINPYIYQSFVSTIEGGYALPRIFISITRKPNKYEYSLSGAVLYSSLEYACKFSNKIKPIAGDVIRIDFPNVDLYAGQCEEYELTDVIDRKPTASDGINPLLGRYVWKCKAKRRIPSYEKLNGENFSEQASQHEQDLLSKEQHNINSTFKDIFDYADTAKDNIYGGYDPATANELDPDIDAITPIIDGMSSYFTIFDFKNGVTLETDGRDLFKVINGTGTNLTNNIANNSYTQNQIFNWSVPAGDYLRVKNGQLYFLTSVYKVNNEYVKNNLTPNVTADENINTVSFDKFIKEQQQRNVLFYTLDTFRFALYSIGTGLYILMPNAQSISL